MPIRRIDRSRKDGMNIIARIRDFVKGMRQKKKWLVTFSLLYRDGRVRDMETRVKAESIMDAIREAQQKIYRTFGDDFATEIDRYVIWDVGIMNNWVF